MPDTILPMEIRKNADLAGFNSFGTGARATRLIQLRSVDQVPSLLGELKQASRVLVLGVGSNVLFKRDFDGLVVINQLKGKRILAEDENSATLDIAAGENWHDFVRWSLAQEFFGLENLSLIPGSVGAAPIQNIGAYGVELERYFESLSAIDLASGEQREFDRAQCRFGYRDSCFKAQPDRYLIVSVRFRLDKILHPVLDYAGIREMLVLQGANPESPDALQISDAISTLRVNKLPPPELIGNVGSFFKNPLVSVQRYSRIQAEFPDMPGYRQPEGTYKLSAAWLIEQCGWKGYRNGDAGVYERHALVLVNHGTATGEQIWQLASRIRQSVSGKFGIELEPEPRVIPD